MRKGSRSKGAERKFSPKPATASAPKSKGISPPWQFVMAVVPFEGLRYLQDGGTKYWSKISRALIAHQEGDLDFGSEHANGVRIYQSFGHIPDLPLCAAFFVQRNGTWANPKEGWKEPSLRVVCNTAGKWRAVHTLPGLSKPKSGS